MTKTNTPLNHNNGGGQSSYGEMAMVVAVGMAVMKMTAAKSSRWHQWQQRGADCRWNITIN
jgi:hypothetical protein